MSEPTVIGVVDALRAALPENSVRVGAAIEPRHLGDWVVKAGPDEAPLALTLPRSTDEISTILKICHAHYTPVVPQGGLTGLTGGATASHGAVLVSLKRMCAIEEIDPVASPPDNTQYAPDVSTFGPNVRRLNSTPTVLLGIGVVVPL